MRPYFAFAHGEFHSWIIHRVASVFTLLGTLVYISFVYFVWRSIYREAPLLHGMTFTQAFTYLAVGGAVFACFRSWIEWEMSWKITEGNIVVDLLKPVDFQVQNLCRLAGYAVFNLVVVAIPSALLAFLVFGARVPLGFNCVLAIVALFLAFIITSTLDFMTGLTAFYTQSLWGISMTKDVIVSLLSGVLIPPAFFPEPMQKVLAVLPFQAIYYTPLTVLTTPHLGLSDYVRLLGIQAFWVVLLLASARVFYVRASRVLTVAGG